MRKNTVVGEMKACDGGSGRCGPVGHAFACLVAISMSKSMLFRHTSAHWSPALLFLTFIRESDEGPIFSHPGNRISENSPRYALDQAHG